MHSSLLSSLIFELHLIQVSTRGNEPQLSSIIFISPLFLTVSLLSLDFNRKVKQLDDGLEITHSGDFSFILSPWTLVEGI